MSLFQMSASAGLLVIAIMLIRALALNKLPKKMFLVLWSVVLFRLIVPFAITTRLSFYSAIGELFDMIFSLMNTSEITTNGLTSNEAASPIIAPLQETVQFISFPLHIIWLVGMVAVAIYFIAIYYRNYKSLKSATHIYGNDYLKQWLKENKLIRNITIMQSDKITTPIAVGIIRPRILLPKFIDLSDRHLLSHILTHEYFHIKRFDPLWKLLITCAVCIHWFNPLMWVMLILANRDMELSCDELVIRRFGVESKTSYATSIINMAQQQRRYVSLLYFGFSKNPAEERVLAIMKTKTKTSLSMIIAFVLVLLLTIGAMSLFIEDKQSDQQAEPMYTQSEIKHDENNNISDIIGSTEIESDKDTMMQSFDNEQYEIVQLKAYNVLLKSSKIEQVEVRYVIIDYWNLE